jgi:catechol 2,3-dioxygenase-like lactoylglutathione lyase family enzyme
MKRMHVGLKVDDMEKSIDFYTLLFGIKPTMQRPDYAKWMLDDPRVNFSIDTHGDGPAGSAHYGIQHESLDELAETRKQIDAADLVRRDQNDLICGYQQQDKSWVTDPHGVPWEAFYTVGVVDGAGYGCEELPGDV